MRKSLWSVIWVLAMSAEMAMAQSKGPAARTYAGFRLGGGFAESRDFGTGGSFETDPKVTEGYFVGPVSSFQRREMPGSIYADGRDNDVDQFISGVRAAYGRGQFETGAMVPYIRNQIHGGPNKTGFGDVQVYGKMMPVQFKGLDAGFGMTMIMPSGSAKKRLGYGELGFLPFGTAALHVEGNPLELRGSFGYRLFIDDHSGHRKQDGRTVGDIPPESMVYRGGLLISPNEAFTAKIDFAGESIDIAGPSQPMSIEPGLEIRMRAKALDVVIQPTGLIGLNGEAPSWGVGIGFAVTGSYQTEKARKAQPF